MKSGLCCLLLVVVITGISAGVSRPRYVECTASAECPVDHCCVLGMNKFSMPNCQLLGLDGSPCRPSGKSRNVTLTYPNGQDVDFVDVFNTLCPCAAGFHCSHASGTCVDTYDALYSNHLNDDEFDDV